jgi:threonine dehydratase
MEEWMISADITLRDIYRARGRIAPIVRRTPLILSPWLTEQAGYPVYFKLENLQETGSFKIRGAANKLSGLPEEARRRGVITVSSGNHGRALAYVARRFGVRAVVCLSEAVPGNKREGIRRLGGEVVVRGRTYDEAAEHALLLQEELGLEMVYPFDDPLVIAGQGTIGLELLEELPELQAAVVPLSGGGLLGGIALALKSADPRIRVIGVSMERGPAMVESLRAGRVVDIVEEPTLADALAGGISPNRHTFDLVSRTIDETVLVSEEEIAEAMAFALEKHHLVVEGGGAVGIAALLSGKLRGLGGPAAVVVSGGNVDLPTLLKIADECRRE